MKGFLTRLACAQRDPNTAAVCTRPNEPAGHEDGMHVDGSRAEMRGWIDDRTVHQAIGMTGWDAADADPSGAAR